MSKGVSIAAAFAVRTAMETGMVSWFRASAKRASLGEERRCGGARKGLSWDAET
jgi:hypothetical protein